jgi:hypothetical protein
MAPARCGAAGGRARLDAMCAYLRSIDYPVPDYA